MIQSKYRREVPRGCSLSSLVHSASTYLLLLVPRKSTERLLLMKDEIRSDGNDERCNDEWLMMTDGCLICFLET